MLGVCWVVKLTRSGGWQDEAWAYQYFLGVTGTFAFSAMLRLWMMAQMPICLYQANCAMPLSLDVYIVRRLLVGVGHYRSAHE